MSVITSPELAPPAIHWKPPQTIPGFKHSATVAEVFGALVKAQAAFQPIVKEHSATVTMKSGGQYHYAYADLAAVIDATRPALSANGLAVTQSIDYSQGGAKVTSVLAHTSGEWIAQELAMPAGEPTPQAIGSVITYARRYSMSLLLGVASVEDDDGAAASGGNQRGGQRQQQQRQQPPRQQQQGQGKPQGQLPSAFQSLKSTLFKVYKCQNPDDCGVILQWAYNDTAKDFKWLADHMDQAEAAALQVSKWATESNLDPATALEQCKAAMNASGAFESYPPPNEHEDRPGG